MTSFMVYVKSLQTNQLNDKVDYEYLRKLFKGLFLKNFKNENFEYDWVKIIEIYCS